MFSHLPSIIVEYKVPIVPAERMSNEYNFLKLKHKMIKTPSLFIKTSGESSPFKFAYQPTWSPAFLHRAVRNLACEGQREVCSREKYKIYILSACTCPQFQTFPDLWKSNGLK